MANELDPNVLFEMKSEAKKASQDQLITILADCFADAFNEYRAGLKRHLIDNPDADPSKYKFRLALALDFHPAPGGSLIITPRGSFGIKMKYAGEDIEVSMHPELQPGMGKNK